MLKGLYPLEKRIMTAPVFEQLPINENERPLGSAYTQIDPIDLSAWGYIEEEYLFSGKSHVYTWSEDGQTAMVAYPDNDYCTRIVVRKPADPAKFSGHIFLEPMNGTEFVDMPGGGWGLTFEYMMNAGDMWIGLSCSDGGFIGMKTFNPERYGRLNFDNPVPKELRIDHIDPGGRLVDDTFEKGLMYDVCAQLGVGLRECKEGTPTFGYDVRFIYMTGLEYQITYANVFNKFLRDKDGKSIFDGFLQYQMTPGGSLNRDEDFWADDDPRNQLPVDVPFIKLKTSGDLRGVFPHPFWACTWRCRNMDLPEGQMRWYEVAGTSLRYAYRRDVQVAASYEDYIGAGRLPFQVSWPRERVKWENLSMKHIMISCSHNLKEWVEKGIPAPIADYIEIDDAPKPYTQFVMDEHGNQLGGIRSTYVDVPVATYVDDGTVIPFSREKLIELYGTKDNFVKLITDRAFELLEQRWLVPESVQEIIKQAVDFDGFDEPEAPKHETEEYNYDSKSYWDSDFIERCPPARAELAQQARPKTQLDMLKRMGDEKFDAYRFINSEMGKVIADLRVGYPDTGNDDNPDADKYWEGYGYIREYHPDADPAHAWVSIRPKDIKDGELLPLVVLIHGGQSQGLASEMESSGYIHEIIKRDAALFVLPANTETDNTIFVMDEAEKLLPVDKSREYIIGFSGGGAWARYTALTNPYRFAAYAPNGTHTMSWQTLIRDDDLVELRKAKLPAVIYSGLNEFLKIFPMHTEGVRFKGILGKDEQPGTPDEKYICFRRCLYATGCDDITPVECLDACNDENPARRMSGIPGGDARIENVYGADHAIIDFTRDDGEIGMRVICVENQPHVVAPSAAAMVWDFLRRYKR